jgi:hypothetical protein
LINWNSIKWSFPVTIFNGSSIASLKFDIFQSHSNQNYSPIVSTVDWSNFDGHCTIYISLPHPYHACQIYSEINFRKNPNRNCDFDLSIYHGLSRFASMWLCVLCMGTVDCFKLVFDHDRLVNETYNFILRELILASLTSSRSFSDQVVRCKRLLKIYLHRYFNVRM